MQVIVGVDQAKRHFERRTIAAEPDLTEQIAKILEAVRREGDSALRRYSVAFDGVALAQLAVDAAAITAAEQQLAPELRSAIGRAIERVRTFYGHQPKEGFIYQDDGSLYGQLVRPLAAVGCYIPGGQAPLFSSLIMTAVPAQVAGVPRIVVATPPRQDGSIAPEILFTAQQLGISEIYRIGGAQAIAALAYGTESIAKVDKIVGPGSQVTVIAKKLVFGDVGIEALPGPTETLIIADDSADVRHVAYDLLAQAEHSGAQPVLVTTSAQLIDALPARLADALTTLATADVAKASLAERGVIVRVASLTEAAEVANHYAAEHLCLLVRDPWALVPLVAHAGGLFIGEHSMEALGDYLAGPSHVMPTGGTARFSSAINVRDFQKVIPFISLSPSTVAAIGEDGARMARAEGLEAHARAIESRASKS
jgi:histidinol dehydrogenase